MPVTPLQSILAQYRATSQTERETLSAEDTLSRAVTECSDDKFRAALQAELESLRIKFP